MGCCPTTYWCTADGPTAGTTDEDTGITTPPEGATSGPHATFADAYAVCPPPAFDCGSFTCDNYPSAVSLNFGSRTGSYATDLPNSVVMDPVAWAGGLAFEGSFTYLGVTHNVALYLPCFGVASLTLCQDGAIGLPTSTVTFTSPWAATYVGAGAECPAVKSFYRSESADDCAAGVTFPQTIASVDNGADGTFTMSLTGV